MVFEGLRKKLAAAPAKKSKSQPAATDGKRNSGRSKRTTVIHSSSSSSSSNNNSYRNTEPRPQPGIENAPTSSRNRAPSQPASPKPTKSKSQNGTGLAEKKKRIQALKILTAKAKAAAVPKAAYEYARSNRPYTIPPVGPLSECPSKGGATAATGTTVATGTTTTHSKAASSSIDDDDYDDSSSLLSGSLDESIVYARPRDDLSLIESLSKSRHRIGRNNGNRNGNGNGNSRNDSSNYNYRWFTSHVSLSVLENRRPASMARTQSWGKLFVSGPERIVRDSVVRHLQLYCNDNDTTHSTNSKSRRSRPHRRHSTTANSVNLSASKDPTSLILQDPSQAEGLVKECLRVHNYEGAIAAANLVLQTLLLRRRRQTQSQQSQSQTQSQQRSQQRSHSTRHDTDTAIATLAGQLALLSLAAGRTRDALSYSEQAVHHLPSRAPDDPSSAASTTTTTTGTIISVLLNYGLVQLGCNKVGQALKAWLEAMHMAIAVENTSGSGSLGYEHESVAVLLNDIGVLHLLAGNLQGSTSALEEALELQRSILSRAACQTSRRDAARSSRSGSVDGAIFRLATTMGNLALTFQNLDKCSSAISLLDEAMALYESSSSDTSTMEAIIRHNLERLSDDDDQRHRSLNETTESMDSFDLESRYECRYADTAFTHDLESFRTEDEYLLNESTTCANESWADTTVDGRRYLGLFGNTDGIPSRRIAAKVTPEPSDYQDFLVLGPLSSELSAEQRVRETVFVWFGKRIGSDQIVTFDLDCDEPTPTLLIGSSPPIQRVSSDSLVLDDEVMTNAELHLSLIYEQATTYLDANYVGKALDLFRCTLRSHRNKYGKIHHLVGTALHNIGMVQLFAQKYDDAIVSFREAASIRVASLGPDHPSAQASEMKVALIQLAQGNATESYDKVVEIRQKLESILGYGHPQLAKISNNVGVVAFELGDLTTAKRSFDNACASHRRLLDTVSSNDYVAAALTAAHFMCNLAFVYTKGGEHSRALEVYEEALILLEECLANDHFRLDEIRREITYVVEKCRDDPIRDDGGEIVLSRDLSLMSKDRSLTVYQRYGCQFSW